MKKTFLEETRASKSLSLSVTIWFVIKVRKSVIAIGLVSKKVCSQSTRATKLRHAPLKDISS